MAKIKTYDMKVVEQDQALNYIDFGWLRSKEAVPADLALKTKKPTVLLKRREEYGMNAIVTSNEVEFEKLYKKNNKGKAGKTACAAIFGILVGILMLAFVAVAALNIFVGVNNGLEDDKKIDALDGVLESIHEIEFLNTIDEKLADVQTKVVEILDGVELPEQIAPYVSFNTVVGVVFLVLGIVFIIIFASICKMGKRQNKRAAKMAEAVAAAKAEIERMRKTDVALMTRAQRKQYYWESIITNSLINSRAPVAAKEDDDDDDGYDF